MPTSFLQRIKNWRGNTKLRELLTESVLAIFIALIPFQWKFPPISLVMMIMGVFFLFFISKRDIKSILSNRYLFLLIGYYCWILFGLTYSDYPNEGGKDVLVQIALFAWPLGLVGLNSINRKMVMRLLNLFTRAVALSSLMCLVLAFSSYLSDGDASHFFYKNIAAWPLVPQHYMGMYITFAIIIVIYNLVEGNLNRKWKWIEALFYIGLFLLMQGLLSVRIQYIALPISLLPLFIRAIRLKTFGKKSLRNTLLVVGSLTILIALLPGTQRRVVETYDELRSINRVVNKKQTNHRVFLWRYSTEVIAENWLLGTGTGEGNEALHEKLLTCDAKFWDGTTPYYLYEKKYNAHNVFLQVWMTHGIAGFLLICCILFIPLAQALKRGDTLVAGFLILSVISFSTESMLERQAGVLWFSCFYSLLVVAMKNGMKKENG